MESLDTTILNTALPAIASALNEAPLSMKSILSSYTLSLAVFIPISGWIADRFGTRPVFAAAVAVFTLGSLLCGLSSSVPLLVLCRILQGFGGAMMVPVGRLVLVRSFPKSDLMRVMSFVAIPALIGPMLGPLVGGLLVHYSHWRLIFFLNIPIGLVGLYLIYLHLPNFRSDTRTPLDTIGLILFGCGIAMLSYVLEVFGEHTLGNTEISTLVLLSLAMLAGYWLHAARTEFPLLRMDLFSIRTFRLSVSASFITRLGIGGIPFLLPLLYQVGLGFTPVQSGLLFVPQAVASMILKLVMPRILAKAGYRTVLLTNTVLLGVLIVMLAWITPATPIWQIVSLAGCFGFFSSLQYTSISSLVYADVTESQVSPASTISSTVQQLSASFGVAVASLITAVFIPDEDHATGQQMMRGIHQTLIVLGALTIVSTLNLQQLRSGDGDSTILPQPRR